MTKPAPGPDQPPIPVRLVTFNIHHGVGDDERHDLPRLAKLLPGPDADVICLQEVDRHFGERSEDVDQALLLSRALDMQLAWGPGDRRAAPRGPAARGSTATRCCRGCRS
jgi:endonuclease/exonuclease/phosphatase family metal-dependent hydrolase